MSNNYDQFLNQENSMVSSGLKAVLEHSSSRKTIATVKSDDVILNLYNIRKFLIDSYSASLSFAPTDKSMIESQSLLNKKCTVLYETFSVEFVCTTWQIQNDNFPPAPVVTLTFTK